MTWLPWRSVFCTLQGIMLVYDITNEKSFDNIKNWIRNIEEVKLTIFSSDLVKETWREYKRFNVFDYCKYMFIFSAACLCRCGEDGPWE